MIEKDQISELADAPGPPEGISPAKIPVAALSGADYKLARLRMYMEAARQGMDPVGLNQFRAMMKEDDEEERKEQFFTALAQAKTEFTPIIKRRQVDYEHKDRQGRTKYKYEELADITDVIVPILAKYGITHSFEVDQSDRPKIKVRCLLAHANGYQVEGKWMEGVEDTSGQKSPNQAIASTITFWQRGALKSALGIAAGRDDDGQGAPVEDPVIAIDDVVYIESMIRDTESNLKVFLKTVGAPSVKEMTASQFKRGAGMLERKKRLLNEVSNGSAD